MMAWMRNILPISPMQETMTLKPRRMTEKPTIIESKPEHTKRHVCAVDTEAGSCGVYRLSLLHH